MVTITGNSPACNVIITRLVSSLIALSSRSYRSCRSCWVDWSRWIGWLSGMLIVINITTCFDISNRNIDIIIIWFYLMTRNNFGILWVYLRFISFMLWDSIFVPTVISVSYPIGMGYRVTFCIGNHIAGIIYLLLNCI